MVRTGLRTIVELETDWWSAVPATDLQTIQLVIVVMGGRGSVAGAAVFLWAAVVFDGVCVLGRGWGRLAGGRDRRERL